MDILLVSQNEVKGKVPENFLNMRTEYCWAKILDADMIFYDLCLQYPADIVMFILPKKEREYDDMPRQYKKMYPQAKVGIIQEGSIDMWTDWPIADQESYLKLLEWVDFVGVHNECDFQYLKGLLKRKPETIHLFYTLFDNESVPALLLPYQRKDIIISGNCSSWYGGMYPLQILLRLRENGKLDNHEIHMMGTGRRKAAEKQWCKKHDIVCLDWYPLKQWMLSLNTYKLGINLMPVFAAGSFNLNCAALNIPCIGFFDLDAQYNYHSSRLSVQKVWQIDENRIQWMLTDTNYYDRNLPHKIYPPENLPHLSNPACQEYYGQIVKDILNG